MLYHMSNWCLWGQRKVSDLLEQELQMVGSYHGDAESQVQVSYKNSQYF